MTRAHTAALPGQNLSPPASRVGHKTGRETNLGSRVSTHPLLSILVTTPPTVLVLVSAVLFGIANVAWRGGVGPIGLLAAVRVILGLVFVAPLLVTAFREGTLKAIGRDPVALLACAFSGASPWTAALLFRSVPGPTAAVVIAITPAVALVVGRVVGSRHLPRKSVAAVIACVLLALSAAPHGASAAKEAIAPAALFLFIDVASVLTTEMARRRHAATALTVGGLLAASIPAPLVLILSAGVIIGGFSGIVTALIVAVVGTTGRLMRSQALGAIGAPVVASSSQIIALVTAIGGAIIYADELTPERFAALLGACAACLLALIWSAHATAAAAKKPLSYVTGRQGLPGRPGLPGVTPAAQAPSAEGSLTVGQIA